METAKKPSTAQKFKDLGNEAFKSCNYKQAIEHYTSAINADPSDYVLPCNRAFARLKLLQWKLAESDCTRSLELLPHPNCKALFRRGVARKNLENWADAQQDLKAALALEPQNPSIRAELDIVESHVLTEGHQTHSNQANHVPSKSSPPSRPPSSVSLDDSDLENSDFNPSSTASPKTKIAASAISSDQPVQLLREVSSTRFTSSSIKPSAHSDPNTQASFSALRQLRQKKEQKLSGLQSPQSSKGSIRSIPVARGLKETYSSKEPSYLLSSNSSSDNTKPVKNFVDFETRWGASSQVEDRCLVLEALDPGYVAQIFGEHLEPETLEQIIDAMEIVLKSNEESKILKAVKLIQALDHVSRINTLSMFLEPHHLQVIQDLLAKYERLKPGSSVQLKSLAI